MHMYMAHIYGYSQRPDPLELEVQAIKLLIWVLIWFSAIQVLCKSTTCSYPLSHLSSQ